MNNSKDNDQYLYKYIGNLTEEILTNIIDKQLMKFSHADDFNDPNDSKIYFEECEDSIFQKLNNYNRLAKDDNVIFCSSKTCRNVAMWSHYSSYHRGICLEYSKNELVKKVNENKHKAYGDVIYQSEPKLHVKDLFIEWGNYPNGNRLKDILGTDLVREQFIKKSLDWAYESEYRLIVCKYNDPNCFKKEFRDEKEIFLFKEFPQPKSIILGYKFDQGSDLFKHIKGLSQKFGIKLKKAELANDSYELNIKDL